MIRVILCDDHAMVRRGIRETLSEAVDIQVTGEASSKEGNADSLAVRGYPKRSKGLECGRSLCPSSFHQGSN